MTELNRRQVIKMGVAAGTVAWAAPEIFTAKPVAGATLSFGPGAQEALPLKDFPPAAPTTATKPLPFTGDDIERDAVVGAALIAAGWGIKHWSSRDHFPI